MCKSGDFEVGGLKKAGYIKEILFFFHDAIVFSNREMVVQWVGRGVGACKSIEYELSYGHYSSGAGMMII